MSRHSSLVMAIAAAALAAGCSSATSRTDLRSYETGWQDAGTPTPSFSRQQLTRRDATMTPGMRVLANT